MTLAHQQNHRLDCIQLHGLRFDTIIGINPDESDTVQPVIIDLDLFLMPIQASRTDDLNQSVSYADIYDQTAEIVHTNHVGLVERLAGLLAESILSHQTAIQALKVAVYKPNAPLPGPFTAAGVSIYRSRADFGLYNRVDISLGANLGDRLNTLQTAVNLLTGHPQNRYVAASSVYETTPVGLLDQPDFMNIVLRLETALNPFELLEFCQQIERRFGRERVLNGGPRTLDLDLLTFGQITTECAELVLPHPRMAERDFVQIPLAELNTGEVNATPDVRFSCKLS